MIPYQIYISAILSVIIILATGSSAIGVSLIYFFTIGVIVCSILGKSKIEKKYLVDIFFTVFNLYLLFSTVVYFGFLENDGFFLYPDQGYFYPNIDDLVRYNSVGDIYEQTLINRVHRDYEGFFFYHGSIGFIAQKYFSGNSLFLQSIHIVFLAILANLFCYKILTYYTTKRKSFRYTFYFACLSPILYYSPWIFRDIHIAFFYSVAIYLIHTKFRFITFLIFGVLVAITIEFRLEHGLFLLVFPFIYIYFNKSKSQILTRLWPALVFIGICCFIGIIIMYFSAFQKSINTLAIYENYTQESLNDGIGSKLYKLPMGIKHVALAIHSPLTPLPPWSHMTIEKGLSGFLVGLVALFTAAYWSFLFIFTLISLSVKSIRKKVPRNVWILLGIFFLFIILNTANISVRRIIAIYPILFLVFVFLREQVLTELTKRKYAEYAILLYISLLVFYILLKVLI